MGKLKEFITKETTNDNESKKLTVLIRILVLYFIAFLILNAAFNAIFCHRIPGLFLNVLIILSLVGIFIGSYYFCKAATLWLYMSTMVVWIFHTIIYYGWGIGAQNYLILLLVLYYFSSYGHYTHKIIFSFSIVLIRMAFHLISNHYGARVVLSEFQTNFSLDVNMALFFWCLSIVVYEFSKDSQELENKLIAYNQKLKEQVNTDTLTGLFNRRKAMEYLETLAESTTMEQGFSICISDIDFFKRVNDEYGHDFGDEALRQVSACLRREMKNKSFVARWGGEEFLIVFPNCNGDDAFVHLVGIQNAIRNLHIVKNDIEIQITMTFGLTEYDANQPLNISLKEADSKLYQGKASGRDTIIY